MKELQPLLKETQNKQQLRYCVLSTKLTKTKKTNNKMQFGWRCERISYLKHCRRGMNCDRNTKESLLYLAKTLNIYIVLTRKCHFKSVYQINNQTNAYVCIRVFIKTFMNNVKGKWCKCPKNRGFVKWYVVHPHNRILWNNYKC